MPGALISFLAVSLVGAAWYIGANRRWVGLLTTSDPRLRYDDTRDPIGWVTGAPYRLNTWLRRARTADERADVELWRVRMLRRFLVWITVSCTALLVGDLPGQLLITDVDSMVRRYGSEYGLFFALVLIGVGAYCAWWVVKALWDFGNGEDLRPIALGLGIGGVVATIIALTIMPGLDLRK